MLQVVSSQPHLPCQHQQLKMFKLFTLYGSSSAQTQRTPYENNHHTKGLFVSQQAVCYLRDGRVLSELKSCPCPHHSGVQGRGSGIVQSFLTSAKGRGSGELCAPLALPSGINPCTH